MCFAKLIEPGTEVIAINGRAKPRVNEMIVDAAKSHFWQEPAKLGRGIG